MAVSPVRRTIPPEPLVVGALLPRGGATARVRITQGRLRIRVGERAFHAREAGSTRAGDALDPLTRLVRHQKASGSVSGSTRGVSAATPSTAAMRSATAEGSL